MHALPKSRRILKRRDFVRIQKQGAGAGSKSYVVIVHAHELVPPDAPALPPHHPSRLGVVASRRTGNAVARNRGKRVVREWFRLYQQDHRGYDVVVIIRSGAPSLSLDQARRELDNGLRRAIKKANRAKQRGPIARGKGGETT